MSMPWSAIFIKRKGRVSPAHKARSTKLDSTAPGGISPPSTLSPNPKPLNPQTCGFLTFEVNFVLNFERSFEDENCRCFNVSLSAALALSCAATFATVSLMSASSAMTGIYRDIIKGYLKSTRVPPVQHKPKPLNPDL